MQFLANVSEPPLGTAHPSAGKTPDYSAYMLVKEGTKRDMGGGVVQWTRTYAAVPSPWQSWEAYSYNYSGSAPFSALAAGGIGRFRFTEPTPCRVVHDYFACDASFTANGTTVFNSPGDIPIINATVYVAQFVESGTTTGGVYYKQDYLSDIVWANVLNVGPLLPTIPSIGTYVGMIRDAIDNAWDATITEQVYTADTLPKINNASSTWGGQLVAEDSQVRQWMGPIYERVTKYILAR